MSFTTPVPTSLCRHFGLCGGCLSQNTSYIEQLESKRQRFERLLSPLGEFQPEISPSPLLWEYRNKMEFSFGAYKEEKRLGLKKKGDWNWVVDLEECPIFDAQSGKILDTVRAWAHHHQLPPYLPRKHQGFLRFLILRKGVDLQGFSRLLMVLITSSAQSLPAESLLKALKECNSRSLALIHGVHDSLSDAAIPQSLNSVQGEPYLWEELAGLRLRYPAMGFFQPNPRAFELLLKDLTGQARAAAPGFVFDLYCGVGTIALALHQALKVPALGIEFSNEAIDNARYNAQTLFPSADLKFEAGPAEKIAPDYLKKPEIADGLVVLDPPRSGLHPKMRKALIENPPKNLFYVSCNPELALREDLPALSQNYKITYTRAYDFFPHTAHFEAFFALRRE